MTTGCGIPMTSEAAKRAYPDTVIESHGFTLPLSFAYERGIYDRGAVDALREAAQIVDDTARQGLGLATAAFTLRGEADRIEREGQIND